MYIRPGSPSSALAVICAQPLLSLKLWCYVSLTIANSRYLMKKFNIWQPTIPRHRQQKLVVHYYQPVVFIAAIFTAFP